MGNTFLEIGSRLREIRKTTGLNQEDFAKTLGASYRSYRGFETGQRKVTTLMVLNLYEVMQISPAWFLLGNGNMLDKKNGEIVEAAYIVMKEFMKEKELELTFSEGGEIIRFLYEENISGRPDIKGNEKGKVENTFMIDILRRGVIKYLLFKRF